MFDDLSRHLAACVALKQALFLDVCTTIDYKLVLEFLKSADLALVVFWSSIAVLQLFCVFLRHRLYYEVSSLCVHLELIYFHIFIEGLEDTVYRVFCVVKHMEGLFSAFTYQYLAQVYEIEPLTIAIEDIN